MQVSCLQNFKLSGLGEVLPEIQRFESMKMDGLVPRPSIEAVCTPDRGLQFQIPTPPRYTRLLDAVWQKEMAENDITRLPVGDALRLDYTEAALSQVAEQCGIKRADRLFEEAERYPDIAAARINAWLRDQATLDRNRKKPKPLATVNHLVRGYAVDPGLMTGQGVEHGVLRAVKSDRFKLGLDTSDLIAVLYGLIREKADEWSNGKLVTEVSVNDTRCHIAVTNKDLQRTTRVGDIVCASMYTSTSDIGMGSLVVESRLTKLVCMNGLKTGYTLRRAHLGGRLDQSIEGLLTERTRALNAAALMSQVRDVMSACFDDLQFEKVVEKMDENQATEASNEEAKNVFEHVQLGLGLGEELKNQLFAQFTHEVRPDGSHNATKDGVIQAITHVGRQIATSESYEKALPFEAIGGKLFSLDPVQFKELVKVKPKTKKAERMLSLN